MIGLHRGETQPEDSGSKSNKKADNVELSLP
jgi:hypothetical protein